MTMFNSSDDPSDDTVPSATRDWMIQAGRDVFVLKHIERMGVTYNSVKAASVEGILTSFTEKLEKAMTKNSLFNLLQDTLHNAIEAHDRPLVAGIMVIISMTSFGKGSVVSGEHAVNVELPGTVTNEGPDRVAKRKRGSVRAVDAVLQSRVNDAKGGEYVPAPAPVQPRLTHRERREAENYVLRSLKTLTVVRLRISTIKFSQPRVSPVFQNRLYIEDQISSTMGITSDNKFFSALKPIHVIRTPNGSLASLDNRRLLIYKIFAEKTGIDVKVRAIMYKREDTNFRGWERELLKFEGKMDGYDEISVKYRGQLDDKPQTISEIVKDMKQFEEESGGAIGPYPKIPDDNPIAKVIRSHTRKELEAKYDPSNFVLPSCVHYIGGDVPVEFITQLVNDVDVSKVWALGDSNYVLTEITGRDLDIPKSIQLYVNYMPDGRHPLWYWYHYKILQDISDVEVSDLDLMKMCFMHTQGSVRNGPCEIELTRSARHVLLRWALLKKAVIMYTNMFVTARPITI